ncbi:hypothetical protein DPMN_103661 [Dreissena polymorpha]|uniref:EGF-like domain-containing protein n=1 Tax=Dreissena polymorpha TaxID=45954 RepID=A0A9D4HEN1_DREPO|nr:hypothetical protein DPMN_103661 [Dreissena polymorpha]
MSIDVQHNCDYIHTKGRTKKMKIFLVTSMLFATLVGNGQCDLSNCQGEKTNFTRPIWVFGAETRTTTMYRMEKRKPDCSFWEEVLSFFTDECDEKNTIVSYPSVINVNVTRTAYVFECCPGYTNTSGDCRQGCDKGTYGANCTFNCSCANITASNRCDQDTGYCLCPPGYYGLTCANECGNGYYGSNCSYRCICDNNATCDKHNGKCNCTETPGWTGTACEKECMNDTFGRDCAENCTCNENQTCDHIDGNCTCKEGHTGQNCSEECANMTYGANCTEQCKCQKNTTKSCDRMNGTCTCKPGYCGIFCMRECDPGYYGNNCSMNCSDNCIGTHYCHHETGECICLGKKGKNCTEECNNDTFGRDCADNCTCNENQTCDHVNGTCTCTEGHTGQNCSEECANMTYGADCTEKCKCQKNTTKSCDRMNGTCTCNPGYYGIFCMQECDPGYYGNNCSMNCSDNCIGTHYCHHETGVCICLGKKGKNCTEECDSGKYGEDCNRKCMCPCSHDQKCDPCSGVCETECSNETHVNVTTLVPDKKMVKEDFLQKNQLSIAFGVVGIVLLIAIIVTVCCCYYKRKTCWIAMKSADDGKRERLTSLVVENVGYSPYDDDDDDGHIPSNVVLETIKVPVESNLENTIKKTVGGNNVDRKSDSPAINRNITTVALEVKLGKSQEDSENVKDQRKDKNEHIDDESDKIKKERNVDMKNNEQVEDDYAIGEPDDDAGESVVIYEDADVSSDDDKMTNQHPAVPENDYDYGYHDKAPLENVSAYNTFEEIRIKRKLSEASGCVDDEEENYDHLQTSVRKESMKKTYQEAYSTMKSMRAMSESGHPRGGPSDVEEDENYNTLETEPGKTVRFSHPDYNRVTIADKITVDAGNFVTDSQRTSMKRVTIGNCKEPIVYNNLSAVPIQPVISIADQSVQSDDNETYPFCEIPEHEEKDETDHFYEHFTDDEKHDTTAKVSKAIANNRSVNDEAIANDNYTIYENLNESSDTQSSNIDTVVTPQRSTDQHVNKGYPLTKDNVEKVETNVKSQNFETENSFQKNGQSGILKAKDRKLHDYEDFKLKF